jgi:GTP-binding protein Era
MDSENPTKAAFVAIVGRPSAGKSSLLNRLCGNKVSIVSNTPQTTRARVRGIVTRSEGQLVFVDTPGFHTSEKKINRYMRDLIGESLSDVEVALYVVDSARKPGDEEDAISSTLRRFDGPVVCAVNKIDVPAARPDEAEAFARARLPHSHIVRVSAETGEGVEDLLGILLHVCPEGEIMYPEEYYTDQDPEFRVAEIIREKAIARVHQEIPHALFVDVADMEVIDDGARLWIRAFVVVERESQKGIVVGRGGSVIKQIRVSAQREIAGLFPYDRIHLDLRVKVNKGWRKNESVLRRVVR